MLNSRLAALAGTRQVEAVLHADRAADAADRAVAGVWRQVLALLRRRDLAPIAAYREALTLFRRLRPEAAGALAGGLRRIYLWGHREAARNLTRALPVAYLRAAARRRDGRRSLANDRHWARRPDDRSGHVARVHHAFRGDAGESVRGVAEHADRIVAAGATAAGVPPGRVRRGAAARGVALLEAPGSLVLVARPTPGADPAAPSQVLTAFDLAAPLRDPPEFMSEEEQRRLFGQLLFPPPPESVVTARVNRVIAPFLQHPRADLAPPEQLAQVVATGYALGQTQQQIAKDLLPHVEGVRASARRVARTWGIALSHDAQHEAHEALGDLVIGFQVHATLDQYTRPHHAARSGTIYYKNPGPGQLGLDRMPHPPREADGSLAWC